MQINSPFQGVSNSKFDNNVKIPALKNNFYFVLKLVSKSYLLKIVDIFGTAPRNFIKTGLNIGAEYQDSAGDFFFPANCYL
jgi:hypothetical protein